MLLDLLKKGHPRGEEKVRALVHEGGIVYGCA
jgi:hypothetical protein